MNSKNDIIAIGGIGGSGTRVVAQILEKLNYFIGYDLNVSYDNLLFTLLFKRQEIHSIGDDEFNFLVDIFMKIMSSNEIITKEEMAYLSKIASNDRLFHPATWLSERLRYINKNTIHNSWGWKEPNTHIVIDKLFDNIENLKFIYVYRNGLDMAYSSNQNQLKFWGREYLGEKNLDITPKNSLKYWCMTHKRMQDFKKQFPNRVLMLNFDRLCEETSTILDSIKRFLGSKQEMRFLETIIKKPASIGRYKNFPLENFDKEDLDFISTLYNNMLDEQKINIGLL